MIKMPRCRRSKNVVGLREGGVHHKHDPHGARLQPSLPALLSGNPDSGHSGVFFSGPAAWAGERQRPWVAGARPRPPGPPQMRRIRPGPRDSKVSSRGGDHPSHWHSLRVRRFPDSDDSVVSEQHAGTWGACRRSHAARRGTMVRSAAPFVFYGKRGLNPACLRCHTMLFT